MGQGSSDIGSAEASADDVVEATAQIKRTARGAVPVALAFSFIVQFCAGWLVVSRYPELSGLTLISAVAFATFAVLTPMVSLIYVVVRKKGVVQLAESIAREREMSNDAERREFETRLANAFEMARTEDEVIAASGRALNLVTGEDRVEVLLADNSQAHLEQTITSGHDPAGPGCSVDSPEGCVAARRGQTQIFEDSASLDACPHLVDRSYGQCASVCVPVSIMGRTVGVVHWSEPLPKRIDREKVNQLEVLANQLGGRMGMLRVVAETSLQASTDPLTGLMNRRAFENEVSKQRRGGNDHTIVMADLDEFKRLNDAHGHESGDRALRTFVTVLKSVIRPEDIACRYGGEEFVVAFSDCSIDEAVAACERIREGLVLASADGSVVPFTSSFGVAAWGAAATLPEVIACADRALYEAKSNGRNRAVVYSRSAHGQTMEGEQEPEMSNGSALSETS